jgi:cell division septum initiation protein DivIVA
MAWTNAGAQQPAETTGGPGDAVTPLPVAAAPATEPASAPAGDLAAAPAESQAAKAVRELGIMARVLETRLNEQMKGQVVTSSMFQRGVQSYYVPGVGAFFFINVKFGLAEPSKGEPAAREKESDDLWKQIEQDVEGKGKETRVTVTATLTKKSRIDAQTDADLAARLRSVIFETFAKYGKRIEALGGDERIILIVNGGGFGPMSLISGKGDLLEPLIVQSVQLGDSLKPLQEDLEQRVGVIVAQSTDSAKDIAATTAREALKLADQVAALTFTLPQDAPSSETPEAKQKREEALAKARRELDRASAAIQEAQQKMAAELAKAQAQVQQERAQALAQVQQETAKARDEVSKAMAQAQQALAQANAEVARAYQERAGQFGIELHGSQSKIESLRVIAKGGQPSVMIIQFPFGAITDNPSQLAEKAQITSYLVD